MIVHVGRKRFDAPDCREWAVKGGQPFCRIGEDLSACGTCARRTSRNNNWHDPPIMLRIDGQPIKPAPTPAPAKGLGDVVARALEAVGIRKRQGCKCGQRQATLNRWFPFGKKN